jgi:HSP20 family protein
MVYGTTLAPLFTLRREMDRLFDDTLGRRGASPSAWIPAVDVREQEADYVFELELPGVDPERVEVSTDNGILTVSGEKTAERREEGEGKWHIVERMTGSFRRTFQLPQNVKEDKTEATFRHGVLTVRVPKAEVPKPKKIAVKSA